MRTASLPPGMRDGFHPGVDRGWAVRASYMDADLAIHIDPSFFCDMNLWKVFDCDRTDSEGIYAGDGTSNLSDLVVCVIPKTGVLSMAISGESFFGPMFFSSTFPTLLILLDEPVFSGRKRDVIQATTSYSGASAISPTLTPGAGLVAAG